jgi:hypothetical protein
MLYWPEPVVRRALASADAQLQSKDGSRTVTGDHGEIFHVDYLDSAQPAWSGRLHYRNVSWGYEIDVQSVELTP